MRTLSSALLTEQKKATSLPAISLVARQYGHPAKAAVVQPGLFGWTQLYSGAETPGYHGSAVAGDGSLIRVRLVGGILQYQRYVPPSGNFTSWSTIEGYSCVGPIAIAACGQHVWIAANVFVGGTTYHVYVFLSTNYGVTFSEFAQTSIAGTAALSGCCNSSGTFAMASVATGIDMVIVDLFTTGGQAGESTKTGMDVDGIAICFDGDWNMVCLVNDGDFLRLYRLVCGAGYRAANGIMSGWELLNTGKATSNEWGLIQQYYDRPQAKRFPIPYRPQAIRTAKRFGLRSTFPSQGYRGLLGGWYGAIFSGVSEAARRLYPPDYMRTPEQDKAIKHAAVVIARGVDNLNLDAPFLCKPPGCSPILSVYKSLERWFFRINPGTDFYDSDWSQAARLPGQCMYGLALCADSTYIYATRNNEVWRSRIPGLAWDIPTAGSGPSVASQTLDMDHIIHLEESITPQDVSTLEVILDNSLGGYASLPSTYIRKGSQVELGYGYHLPGDTELVEVPGGNKYFIEDWTYDRAPGQATVSLHCIDAWGLLENYVIPAPAEFNLISNTHTVYALVERILACIGCSLTYQSRSTEITTVYPKLEVSAGETGASLLRRLLAVVPDILIFNGLSAVMINPGESDPSTYQFTFPESRP